LLRDPSSVRYASCFATKETSRTAGFSGLRKQRDETLTPFFCALAAWVVLVLNGAPEWAAVGVSIVVGFIKKKTK